MPTGTPEAVMACFARLIRWAIVASGTRNAWPISAVLRPPTARSVRAIAEAGRERRMAAHEHQRQRVVVLGPRQFRDSGLPRRRLALAPPPGLLAAKAVGHPPRRHMDQPANGIVRRPLRRPLGGRRQERLLHRVLGVGEVPEPPHDRAEN